MRTSLRTVRGARGALALLAAGVLTLTAAGCSDDGGGKSTAPAPGGTSDAVPHTVRLPKLNGRKLKVTAVWTGAEQKGFTKVLDEFSRRTGAEVAFVPSGDDMSSFVGSKVAGGDPPDVAMLQQPGVLREFARKGWLKPLGDEARAELAKNFPKGWQDLGSDEGKRYGVYFKVSNKSLVWYNTKVFGGAGAKEPRTWAEFLSTAQLIADYGIPPVSVAGADGWTLTDWFENVYLSQAGPEKYDLLARHGIPWTDPSVKDALTALGKLFGGPGLLADGNDGALQTQFPTSVTQTFSGGEEPRAAMVFEGDFAAANILATRAAIGKDAKVFPFPAVGAKPPVVTGGDVGVALKDGPAAQALLTFLASADAARVWAAEGGFLSANKNLDPAAYPDDVLRSIAKALVSAGDDFRFDMSDLAPASFGGKPGQGEWKHLQDFLKNPGDVAGTQRKLESDAAKAFKS
ncbi:sugar ABC transporter substrate-binding protein [Streptomyces eurocidicus]|uniref:Alpha-glucoside transport system substrate-binding protein n=1 Tax=Streptomyces eurocidicus TaxID=66423 RepID=A0A2N8P3Q2_STREU|nr:extracellular solute-binding protein [Streptomyces eurocidicus]MBB5122670.1 alpha-glucoside transport system substrate-binding protein [Streptomyces eurocidicus]MBF6055810.1 extracellular solute-binding protein [Streptomyces eurocidicus]PNE35621.1 sugar ABC transporter substrate-binding protein [Streptomyces eurocidicus]